MIQALDLPVLERRIRARMATMVQQLQRELQRETHSDEAALMGRRITSVLKLLDDLSETDNAARLLRVRLASRISELIEQESPRIPDVRAATDFFASQTGVLFHARRRAIKSIVPRGLGEIVTQASLHDIRPHMRHVVLQGQTHHGPIHANAIIAAPAAFRMRCVDTKLTEDFGRFVRAHDAVAGISGGYFLNAEADIQPPSQRHDPVGLLLTDGKVLSPPVFSRAALIQQTDGRIGIRVIGMANVLHDDGWAYKRTTNRSQAEWVTGPAIAVVGDRVVGHAGPDEQLRVPVNGFCMPFDTDQAIPSRMSYRIPGIDNAIGAGPILVKNGAVTLDLQAEQFSGSAPPRSATGQTGERDLLPRMAAGITAKGELVLLSVDGRNFQRSLGLTLADTAKMMVALGCQTAMNLDGGASKRMAIDGWVVDLPSTEIVDVGTANVGRHQPVHTAVLLFEK